MYFIDQFEPYIQLKN